MNIKALYDAAPYIGVGALFFFCFWGTVDILTSITLNFQEWLRAKRNINTEVPALSASVKELRERQNRFERELERLKSEQVR